MLKPNQPQGTFQGKVKIKNETKNEKNDERHSFIISVNDWFLPDDVGNIGFV